MGSRNIYDIIREQAANLKQQEADRLQAATSIEDTPLPDDADVEGEPSAEFSPVWSVVDTVESDETQRYATNVYEGAKSAWEQFQPSFQQYGDEYDIDPYLLASIAGKESGGNAEAVGPTDDLGLMQFTPRAWEEVMPGHDLSERLDPDLSIHAAAKYLNMMRNWAGGDLDMAVQAYNAGIGRVKKAVRNKDPLSGHTRYYLPSIISGRDQLQSWADSTTTKKGFWQNFLDEMDRQIAEIERQEEQ